MSKQSLAASIAALALSANLFAADAPSAKPAKPAAPAAAAPDAAPPELAQLDFFLGNWNCSGKTFASPMGPEHATVGTVHTVKSVGDRWVHVNYDEKKTAANPTPFHVGVYMGYDAAKKEFVEGCVDNFGGYCTQSSKGWNGDTLAFEGTVNADGPAGSRDTFVKKGAGELTHRGEMQGPDKQWVKTDEETCRKGK